MRYSFFPLFLIIVGTVLTGCSSYDIILRNGTVYDGSGGAPYEADIGIKKDKIKSIGNLSEEKGKEEIDVSGMVVAPGFINTLSWAGRSLLSDGRSMSDILQGVTLEVFGEGSSLGPYKSASKRYGRKLSTFGDYMSHLERQGVSTNVASFVGATTIRQYVLGNDNVEPDEAQLAEMQRLVRQSMEEGALGVGSSLIYPPGYFAGTDELIAMSRAAGEYGGMYISHMRSESNQLIEAVDELITVAAEAQVPAEIYHLKAAGEVNWHKLDKVLEKIDSANEAGLTITANMYNYTGASTGLGACFPPWVQEGTDADWINRMKIDSVRSRVISEMKDPKATYENFYAAAGDPENIIVLEFDKEELTPFIGKTIAEISEEWDMDPAETITELVIRNEGNISAVYFLMSEENIQRQMTLPYMTFCSDARSIAAEGNNITQSTHPRTYGNFARLLGRYVRDMNVMPLEEAIMKLTSSAAEKFGIRERGRLKEGYYADIVVFNLEDIRDNATFEAPHQYAEGMRHVLVNGEFVIKSFEHTGKTPGAFVKGPGYKE
jgi:N-acyl-D-amino-acid deacylase